MENNENLIVTEINEGSENIEKMKETNTNEIIREYEEILGF